jgi:hypothetical protein
MQAYRKKVVTMGNTGMSRLIICTVALTVLVLSGCTSKARLHNLDSGEVIPIRLQNYGIGEGEVVGKLPNGRQAVGAHVLMSGGVANWTTHDCRIDPDAYAWAKSQGFSFDQPHTKYGYAVLVADSTLIKILYAIDRGRSYGCGIDNNGREYRLIF